MDDKKVVQERKTSSSISASIIIGSIIISLSILISSGVLQVNNGKLLLRQPGNSLISGAITAPETTAPTGTTATPSSPPASVDVSLGHFPIKGDANAKVAIIEFGDMRCPFCKQFFDTTETQILSNYVDSGKAKFSFRQFAFLGPASTTAGNAVECANEQNKFWDYYTYLYKSQPDESDTSLFTTDKLTAIATGMGMNGPQFSQCLDTTKFAKNLTTDQAEGQAAGVTGTPSFVIGKLDPTGTKIIGGTVLVGAQPYTAFQSAIDPLLK
jgi:protein-disulfide isomerase